MEACTTALPYLSFPGHVFDSLPPGTSTDIDEKVRQESLAWFLSLTLWGEIQAHKTYEKLIPKLPFAKPALESQLNEEANDILTITSITNDICRRRYSIEPSISAILDSIYCGDLWDRLILNNIVMETLITSLYNTLRKHIREETLQNRLSGLVSDEIKYIKCTEQIARVLKGYSPITPAEFISKVEHFKAFFLGIPDMRGVYDRHVVITDMSYQEWQSMVSKTRFFREYISEFEDRMHWMTGKIMAVVSHDHQGPAIMTPASDLRRMMNDTR